MQAIRLGIGAALLSAQAALGSPAPRLVPQRDVTVSYQISIPGRPSLDVRVAIQAGGTRLRIVGDELPTSFIVDRRSETAAIVLPMLKTFTRVSIARYDPAQTVLAGASFVRGARDVVAGFACTHWRARSARGTAEACLTEDGVILQGSVTSDRKGTLGIVRALRVSYGGLPPQIFTVPDDYVESPLGQAAASYLK
jgi:hypothetical protein